jgi:tetratricopeptide (TPR) repeat protein
MNAASKPFALVCAWLLGFASLAAPAAASPESLFQQGNQAYEQTNYPAAIAAYQALLRDHHRSSAIHFNLGNAFFRHGQLGHAIAQYRHALLLSPRDPDIRANLQFARQAASTPPPWKTLLQSLSLDAWTWLASLTATAFFLALAVPHLRPSLRRPFLPLRLTLAATALAALTGLAAAWTLHRQASVIVTQPDTPVRLGPRDISEVLFTAPDGAELTVLGQEPGWFQVIDRSSRIGWLQTNAAVRFPP